MSVAYNDAWAKDGEAGKTDVAQGVFLHAQNGLWKGIDLTTLVLPF